VVNTLVIEKSANLTGRIETGNTHMKVFGGLVDGWSMRDRNSAGAEEKENGRHRSCSALPLFFVARTGVEPVIPP
jgi:hypothetical protein